MKYMKTLGLAAVAAAALMALVGSSTASATVLCSTTTTPCNSVVPNHTKIGFEAEGSILLKQTVAEGGETFDTCKKSKLTGELSSASNPTGPITTLDWEECTFTTTTVELGKLEVTGPLVGTSIGTVVADAEIKVTISIPAFGSCVYHVAANTSVGTLTEGNPATFDASAVLHKTSGSNITCPTTINWFGSYTMNEPSSTTIAVEPS
jgi:hypothetical protein